MISKVNIMNMLNMFISATALRLFLEPAAGTKFGGTQTNYKPALSAPRGSIDALFGRDKEKAIGINHLVDSATAPAPAAGNIRGPNISKNGGSLGKLTADLASELFEVPFSADHSSTQNWFKLTLDNGEFYNGIITAAYTGADKSHRHFVLNNHEKVKDIGDFYYVLSEDEKTVDHIMTDFHKGRKLKITNVECFTSDVTLSVSATKNFTIQGFKVIEGYIGKFQIRKIKSQEMVSKGEMRVISAPIEFLVHSKPIQVPLKEFRNLAAETMG